MTKKDAVIVYGAGISGRGAAQVLADRKQQVYLYNDMDSVLNHDCKYLRPYNGVSQ